MQFYNDLLHCIDIDGIALLLQLKIINTLGRNIFMNFSFGKGILWKV